MAERSFANPVHARDFPDPFVLKHRGVYWAYATGAAPDGRCFAVMRSTDLVAWEERRGAMEPLAEDHPYYWAPEVWYEDGLFYLYYSVGDEEHMHLRVAVAEHPSGPFRDSGRRLTTEQFAIDAHVFRDRDGARYMFYATDFLEHAFVGTGTVVDRMLDPFTLEGSPRPVARPRYDWHVYDPNRASKGGVRWHTVEGPFVLERKGRYYEMFSAGNWQNDSYGVGYAVSDRIVADGEWEQVCDGTGALPILCSVPSLVRGPGHNSVVRGPDNRQLYCVYHYWPEDAAGRVMAIDRLDWAGGRLVILGPTVGEQPAPNGARSLRGASGLRVLSGEWERDGGALLQRARCGAAEARLPSPGTSFLLEATVRLLAPSSERWRVGVGVVVGERELTRVLLTPEGLEVDGAERTGGSPPGTPWRAAAVPPADHLLRLDVDGRSLAVTVDGYFRWEGRLRGTASEVALVSVDASVELAALELTPGWEELFDRPGVSLADRGWKGAPAGFRPTGELRLEPAPGTAASPLTKAAPDGDYELVVNARVDAGGGEEAGLTIFPALDGHGEGPALALARRDASWRLVCSGPGDASLALPDGFEPELYHQYRVLKLGSRATVSVGAFTAGVVEVPDRAGRVGVAAAGPATLEMVRVTALAPVAGSGRE